MMQATQLTPLEEAAVTRLLQAALGQPGSAAHIARALVVARRQFTVDALDPTRCAGFYVDFEPNSLLAGEHDVRAPLSLHARRRGLSNGAEFMLFLDRCGSLEFLEAAFYGEGLPIAEVTATHHAFEFEG